MQQSDAATRPSTTPNFVSSPGFTASVAAQAQEAAVAHGGAAGSAEGALGSAAGPSTPRVFEKEGWRIESRKGPILNAKDCDALSDELGIPLPEICFGHNSLSLSYTPPNSASPAFSYSFMTPAALDAVDKTGEGEGMVKVSYADTWLKGTKAASPLAGSNAESTAPASTGIKVVKPFDWTYTTTYRGDGDAAAFEDADSEASPAAPSSSRHPGIPLDRLTRPDPILFFEEVPLFEDELHDNGMSSLIVRIRVMPSCWFILSRFFLRVDGVLFRLFDVRLFHLFGSSEVIREVRGRQASYDDVKRRLPPEKPHDLTPLTDPNWVADKLGMLKSPTTGSYAAPSMPEKQTWRAEGRALDVARLPQASHPPS